MIAAKAIWTDKERFVAEATSGHALVVDASTDKTASSPLEIVLVGLCACTGSDVVSILRKKREPFTSIEVQAEAERAESFPKVFTKIKLIYRVGGNVSHKAVEDAIRLSKEKYCSVSAMLEKSAEIHTSIEYTEEQKLRE